MIENIKPTDRIVVDLSMQQIDYNVQKKNSLRQEIAKKYNVPVKNVEINFKPIVVNVDGKRVSLTDNICNNIQNPEYQKQLMQTYINLKNYQDINWEEINKIDNQINAFLDFDQYTKYKQYKLKSLKWSNYLSYGSDNYFDFTKLSGLVLLNSEPANQGGKTTFAIDLMRFALFGKSEKCPQLSCVFNSYNEEATSVVVEACLEIDNEDYVIRRTINRPTLKRRTKNSKCSQTLEYFKIVNGNYESIENCGGESVKSTNNIIKDAIGNVDDFNLVVSANSYTLNSLLRMGATERGELFSRWLGLLSIKKKEEIASKIWKDNYKKTLLNDKYNKQSLINEIEDYKTYISGCNEEIVKLNNSLQEVSDNIINYNEKKNVELSKLKPIMDNLELIDVTTIDNEINRLNSELLVKRGQFQKLKEEYLKIKDITFNPDELENVKEEKNKIEKDIEAKNIRNAEIKVEIKVINQQISDIDRLVEEGVCPTCHQKIDLAEQDKLKSVHINHKTQLINEGVKNKEEIDKLTETLSLVNKKITDLENSQQTLNLKTQNELQLQTLKVNIEYLKSQIEKNQTTKDNIKQNEENIKINAAIRASILTIDSSIKNETNIKENYIREIESKKTTINQSNDEVNKRQSLIKQLEDEEVLVRNWNLYQELVRKNGISKLVLKEALPIINSEVNRLLDGLCDFEVELTLDDSNIVVVNLLRDGVVMDLGIAASGFEGTIASLALRAALGNISSMSKPSLLCIDEVLGPIASTNMENIHELYKRIVTNYDFIINITHNESIYDWHNHIITVTKENNISKIKFIN
jgi:DNA repair exonuclease SbcCD ATPase subunit